MTTPRIAPEHDAPTCPEVGCDGALQPTLYADGVVLHPAGWLGVGIPGWDQLRCASCGVECNAPPSLVVICAWYSVGAREQSRWMKVPRSPGERGLDVITACTGGAFPCPCLGTRVDGNTGNDVLVCTADEDVQIVDAFTMPSDCPRAGRTATWLREVRS